MTPIEQANEIVKEIEEERKRIIKIQENRESPQCNINKAIEEIENGDMSRGNLSSCQASRQTAIEIFEMWLNELKRRQAKRAINIADEEKIEELNKALEILK
jgi:hypothetical protein